MKIQMYVYGCLTISNEVTVPTIWYKHPNFSACAYTKILTLCVKGLAM